MTIQAVLDHIDNDLPNSLTRLLELLRIESISTDPAFKGQCSQAADWLVSDLESIGFQADKRKTPGHPMVVAHHKGGGIHLLFYGHYDVQPIDPIELWDSPPFLPKVENTNNGQVIRGRGSSDDKGQLMTFVEACRAWKSVHKELPAKVSILFEGEEESGSPSLIPFLKANATELKSSIALICDTGLYDNNTPGIVTSLRGTIGIEIEIIGPNKDLHSGKYGGLSANPIRVLNKILAGLHDDNGQVTLTGFYDGVSEISDALRKQWESLCFNEAKFLNDVGLSEPAGEKGRTALEMLWSRPTCDVNGISGGYQGEGFKTVIASKASAKVSFRLVGKQDPQKVLSSFKEYVQKSLPLDCSVNYLGEKGSKATEMSLSHPAFEKARDALSQEWPKPAKFIGSGGSIPIAGYFKEILDMDSLLIGFGRHDDQIHSPNEKYDLESFHKGIRSWARILNEFADLK
tara:strand:- start:355 stop:1734 length:1380 start_codon:yes stop_codon:yes gene_type:complete